MVAPNYPSQPDPEISRILPQNFNDPTFTTFERSKSIRHKTTSPPKHLIIIHNHIFTPNSNLSNRSKGSIQDSLRLKKLFRDRLGYVVTEHENLSAKGMEVCVKNQFLNFLGKVREGNLMKFRPSNPVFGVSSNVGLVDYGVVCGFLVTHFRFR